jgi:hypothetical protein
MQSESCSREFQGKRGDSVEVSVSMKVNMADDIPTVWFHSDTENFIGLDDSLNGTKGVLGKSSYTFRLCGRFVAARE